MFCPQAFADRNGNRRLNPVFITPDIRLTSAIQRPDRRVNTDLPTVNLANKGQYCVSQLQITEPVLRIALFQPDIAGNVGTILRLSACMAVPCDIIEPCGFPFSDKALKRAGMDYAAVANVTRHADWSAFQQTLSGRLVLMTNRGAQNLYDAEFQPTDVLLMGSEGSGAPEEVHNAAQLRVRIPMAEGFRSLNVAVAAGIALSEALRQTGQLPLE
jgi:tRNA (cytidine/uridine-2'-O-)-methyltransferase